MSSRSVGSSFIKGVQSPILNTRPAHWPVSLPSGFARLRDDELPDELFPTLLYRISALAVCPSVCPYIHPTDRPPFVSESFWRPLFLSLFLSPTMRERASARQNPTVPRRRIRPAVGRSRRRSRGAGSASPRCDNGHAGDGSSSFLYSDASGHRPNS